jgi:hypothetical protein
VSDLHCAVTVLCGCRTVGIPLLLRPLPTPSNCNKSCCGIVRVRATAEQYSAFGRLSWTAWLL